MGTLSAIARGRPAHLALGLFEGVLVSVLPIEFNLLVIPAILILWAVAWIRSATAQERVGHRLKMLTAVGCTAIAALLPVKELDIRVGPMDYPEMSFGELEENLLKDWGISIQASDVRLYERRVAFVVPRRTSRREVMAMLARQTNTDLDIGYCGSGAFLLFGACPCFTRLRARDANPGLDAEQASVEHWVIARSFTAVSPGRRRGGWRESGRWRHGRPVRSPE